MHVWHVRYTSMDRLGGLGMTQEGCAHRVHSLSQRHYHALLSAIHGFVMMMLLMAGLIVGAVLLPPAGARLVQKTAGDELQTQLLAAIYASDAEAMRYALDNGASVNAPDAAGTTPLMIATHSANDAPLLLLLERGAKPDLADMSGTTALMYAATADRPLALRHLLAAGADPRLTNKGALDALAIARAHDNWRAADVLEHAVLASDGSEP